MQLALLLVFGIVVAVLARRAPKPGDGFQPYLGGHLATLIALLAFLLGGLLSAALNLGVAGLLGTAVPGRLVLPPAPGNSLYVPWPVYAFGAAALGALAGALVAALLLYLRYRKNWKRFNWPRRHDLGWPRRLFREWQPTTETRPRARPPATAGKSRRPGPWGCWPTMPPALWRAWWAAA